MGSVVTSVGPWHTLHVARATKWVNLFAIDCDPWQWRRGSWWLRTLVAGYNAAEVIKTPLWPHFHLDGRSSMARLDQSASQAELIISVCPSIDVLQTFDISSVFCCCFLVCIANFRYADLSIKIFLYQAVA